MWVKELCVAKFLFYIRIGFTYMSQDNLIKFQCSQCKRIGYWSHKNRKKVERKIELKKFCNWCKKHTLHKEGKK